ncbi:MAG: 23S rRNA (pseudouridine(1915)-N(3))-methyltransferase RlmH [Clostridiales bacterium]|nr:23S rRNA (pseudouridine(1915)-N(3))-methyltransferase RlmH [Clostridiales bacterium]
MLNVTIICLGKLKEDYWREAASEYTKRLGAYCKLTLIQLEPERLSDNPSDAQTAAALACEAAAIKAKIPTGAKVFSLCIEGKQLSSEQLAEKINAAGISGSSKIVFIIGSSFGLSDEIKGISDEKLSFSSMTFPHQLARIMLLEQLYRAFQINSGGKYHK